PGGAGAIIDLGAAQRLRYAPESPQDSVAGLPGTPSSKNSSDPTPRSDHAPAPAGCSAPHPHGGPGGTTPTPWPAIPPADHAEPVAVAFAPMVLQWALSGILHHSRFVAGARLRGAPAWFYQLRLHPQTQ